MRSGVDFLQTPDGDMGVDLRRLQTSVAELLLDMPDVRSAPQHQGHAGGVEQMAGTGLAEPGARHQRRQVAHRCGTCHTLQANRIAGDDNERELLALVIRPLVRAPFPI
jgi:hypothetical protein